MEEHVGRFMGQVAQYGRYRLRIPVEVMRVLEQRCGLRVEDLVADVGGVVSGAWQRGDCGGAECLLPGLAWLRGQSFNALQIAINRFLGELV